MAGLPAFSRVRGLWDRLGGTAPGRAVFGLLVGRAIPYTGSIAPRVLELRPGFAKVAIRDRRAVRNHLRSIHALAILNLAEFTSGMALNVGLPDDGRSILTRLEIDYLKKARGTITATCACEIPATLERRTYVLEVPVTDASGEMVAIARPHWLVDAARTKVPAAA